jgi:ATP-dependent Clp protease, protease subunit
MSKRSLPQARADRPDTKNLQWDIAPRALESWSPSIVAASEDSNDTISIYDVIGSDPWTGEGTTAKRIAAALRSIGASKKVTVNINSPGGDMFEGLAIYNLLRQHEGHVTVRVLGLAASAASIIAMAGDTVQVGRAAFLMVHDCWAIVIGNRRDLIESAATLEPFDRAMAGIYAAHTGASDEEMLALMDAETWINGAAAVEQGFADALLPAEQIAEQAVSDTRIAAHLLDMALARAGLPRSERRAMLQAYKAGDMPSAVAAASRTPSAAPAPVATRNAGDDVLAAMRSFSLDIDMRSASMAIAAEVFP